MENENKKHLLLLLLVSIIFVWAFIKPYDYFTLLLEVAPVIIGISVLLATYKHFRLTTFLYIIIAVNLIVALIGGHYSYGSVPVFNWLKENDIFVRNNYDKLGHFVQGVCSTMIAREILLRISPLKKDLLLNLIVISVCLAVAALYEIMEFLAAYISGSDANLFLGTQGYIWDTQTDMLWAFMGGVASILFLSKLHDRALMK